MVTIWYCCHKYHKPLPLKFTHSIYPETVLLTLAAVVGVFLRPALQTCTMNWLKLLLKMKPIFHPWVPVDLLLFTKRNVILKTWDSYLTLSMSQTLYSHLLFIKNLFSIYSLQVFWLWIQYSFSSNTWKK